MRQKCKFWLSALVFASLFAVLLPTHAFAVAAVDPCPLNNQIDTTAANNQKAHAQDLFNRAHNINPMFPISPAANACVRQVMDIYEEISSISASASGLAGIVQAAISLAINKIIDGIIQAVCQAALSTIESAEATLKSLGNICIPIPSFGGELGLQFPTLPCIGSGQQVFTLQPDWPSSPRPPAPPAPYDYLSNINNGLQ